MDGQIVAEGAEVGVSQEWDRYLDQFKDIAGSLLAVFFVALVVVLLVWLGIAAFTHMGKSQAAKRIFGILTTAALAGCLVSTIGWSIKSTEDGGAGLGSVSVSGGEQVDLEVDGHEPKQWTVEDVQGGSDDEEESSDPPPSEEPTTEEPTPEPPADGEGETKEGGGPCTPSGPQSNLAGGVGAAIAPPCQ